MDAVVSDKCPSRAWPAREARVLLGSFRMVIEGPQKAAPTLHRAAQAVVAGRDDEAEAAAFASITIGSW